jgi:hypothetical protein
VTRSASLAALGVALTSGVCATALVRSQATGSPVCAARNVELGVLHE